MRYHYTLNINLNIIGRRNSLADCTDRALHAVNVLREFDCDLKARRDITENEDGPEITLDDVLIVQMSTSNPNGFHVRLHQLVVELEQEAIAVYEGYSANRHPPGYLLGPKVKAWGPFNVGKMKFIDPNISFAPI